MTDDTAEARAARAAQLKKEIAELTKSEPEPGQPQSPRDFIARRMRELAEENEEERRP
jgi:hypothetical protein